MLFLNEIHWLEKGADITYFPEFVDEAKAGEWFDKLVKEVNFKPDTLKLFGKTITTSRLVAWHGDEPYDYAYSGHSRVAQPWTPVLQKIKNCVEKKLNRSFNCCLLNYYADGAQGMSWHSDDEQVMQKNGAIASLSLGAARYFEFKHKTEAIRKKFLLENGSLLLMQGETQKHFLHQLPKSTKISKPRINLTFRNFSK